MYILLTNDDGIHSPGLHGIYNALLKKGHEVQVVAPLTEQSAVAHGITVRQPLRAKEIDQPEVKGFAVSGTPADCVKFAMGALLKRKPDLVISGINAGANVGPDIFYSGTVAGAAEGALLGLPALALSHHSAPRKELEAYSAYCADFVDNFAWDELQRRTVLNLNLPPCPFTEMKGLKVCSQSLSCWKDSFTKRVDPKNREYWWADGQIPASSLEPDCDARLVEEGYATLTPLRMDLNDPGYLTQLEKKFSKV